MHKCEVAQRQGINKFSFLVLEGRIVLFSLNKSSRGVPYHLSCILPEESFSLKDYQELLFQKSLFKKTLVVVTALNYNINMTQMLQKSLNYSQLL